VAYALFLDDPDVPITMEWLGSFVTIKASLVPCQSRLIPITSIIFAQSMYICAFADAIHGLQIVIPAPRSG
jgi:hypothetical protein